MNTSTSYRGRVWDGSVSLRTDAWTTPVDSTLVDEFHHVVGTDTSAEQLCETYIRGTVELPRLRGLASYIRQELDQGLGFVHVVGLAAHELSHSELKLFQLMLSLEIGDHYGYYKRLHEVNDVQHTPGPNDKSMHLHTDSTLHLANPKVISLMCLRPAISGGENLLVNMNQVHEQLEQTDSSTLIRLQEDFYRSTATPWCRTIDPRKNKFPIFSLEDTTGYLVSRFARQSIETGYRSLGIELSAEQIDALDRLTERMEDSNNLLQIPLKSGEILYVNNWFLAHSRRPFVNYEVKERQRLSIRTWTNLR